MRTHVILVISMLLATLCMGQNKTQSEAITYDSTLASKLGADQFGMKEYVMVILNKGPVTINDASEKNKIIKEHLKSMDDLTKEGKVVFSGPLVNGDDMQWMVVFEVKTTDEAQALINTDPGVTAGMFSTDMHLWYGPAALQEVSPLNKALEKKNFL